MRNKKAILCLKSHANSGFGPIYKHLRYRIVKLKGIIIDFHLARETFCSRNFVHLKYHLIIKFATIFKSLSREVPFFSFYYNRGFNGVKEYTDWHFDHHVFVE